MCHACSADEGCASSVWGVCRTMLQIVSVLIS